MSDLVKIGEELANKLGIEVSFYVEILDLRVYPYVTSPLNT